MKYIKAIVSIIVLTAIDQITKFLAVRYLMEGGPIVLIDVFLNFVIWKIAVLPSD